MPNVSVIMKGERDFAETFREIGGPGADSAIREFHTRGAQVTLRRTRPLVPVGRTGRLKDSLKAAGAQRGGVVVVGDAKAFYVRWVHNGTDRIRRQPFMYQGADQAAPEVHDIGYEIFGRLLEQGNG